MNIEFIPIKKSYEPVLKFYPPVQANRILPSWYKNMERTLKLENGLTGRTAKKCPAIQDVLTTGFVIPLWSNFEFASVKDINGNITQQNWKFNLINAIQEPLEHHISSHENYQISDMDLHTTVDGSILKLTLPYKIVIPEGYNILYTDPFYHFRKDIRCLTGIVETDKWGYLTLPFELLSNNFLMLAGTPLIHCFIYKREDININIITRNGSEEEYNKVHEDFFELFSNDKNYRTK